MEKLDSQEHMLLIKDEEHTEASKLYFRCRDWAIRHYSDISPEKELSELEAENYEIAKVLLSFLRGEDPFKQFRKTQEGVQGDTFQVRVGALILTKNKKKVSEFFDLPDDGKTLNTFIATRAREFFTEDALKGLSVAQKANRVVELINQNSKLRKEHCRMFMFYYPFFLNEKINRDCTYQNYSFRGWIKMASTKKGRAI